MKAREKCAALLCEASSVPVLIETKDGFRGQEGRDQAPELAELKPESLRRKLGFPLTPFIDDLNGICCLSN